MSLAFIACAEGGSLEYQTRLLCHSIRRYGGVYRDAPIYTFQPRRGRAVGTETLAIFDALGVVHNPETLNTEFAGYAYGNKLFVSARAEELLPEEVLVFLDSDTIITGEPADLDLPETIQAAAAPVSNGRLGSTGPGHPNEEYWRKMYKICGVKHEGFVTTVIDRQRIRPYFNSGLVAVRRRTGLFQRWRENFLRLMSAGHIAELTGIAGMDEFSLAATLGEVSDRMRILDARYNYPLELNLRPTLPSPFHQAQLEDLIHVHYRFWFHRPGFLQLLQPPLDPASEVLQWLGHYLPLKPVIDDAWIAERRLTPGKTIHQVERQ